MGNILKLISIGKYILEETPTGQTLRSINKWDLMELKSFCMTRALSFRQNVSLHSGKLFLSTTHPEKKAIYQENI